jgi:rfaE bifunctional protein nucleotidyltransferase chain/domain
VKRAAARRPPPPGTPVLDLAAVSRMVARLRRRRPAPRIVLANGLFDVLHVGHLRYLRGAKCLGDVLVVAVNDDRSARRLRGPGRPLVPAADRARLVAAVRGVDAVLVFGGTTVGRVLRRLKPDVHCKGTDYTPATVPERAIVREYGGVVRTAGDRKRHATTDIIRRIAGGRR